MMQARPGYRIRHIGPPSARVEIEVPHRDELGELIDLIDWRVPDSSPLPQLERPEPSSLNADEDRVDLRDKELTRLREENEALRNRPPEVVEKIVERLVEAPAPPPVVEEGGGADGIPESFRSLMLDGEQPERFTERMRRRLQYLKHMQIDGAKPTNARALPDMSEEEIEDLKDLEARNLKSGNWLG